LELVGCRIANAVRCLPPKNKPTPQEANKCRQFLVSEIESMPNLSQVLALGRIAHETVLRALKIRLVEAPFAHGAAHRLGDITITDSYHCSRYNTNTGRLTKDMFYSVINSIRQRLDAQVI
ncbi:MAG: uracil-DNA glycosylase family protein, partial [Rhodospirillales bacterium]